MRQVHVNDQYATCHRAWGETYVLTSFIVCRVGWLGIPECENLTLMRISIRAPAFKASLLLNAWLLGALFWQAHYLCNLRRPGRRAPGQATKSADRHDAVQVVVVQQNGSTQSSAAVQDGGWHANVTNGVVAMDGANNISTLIAVTDCREKQNSFCNLHGVNYTCVLFPGSSQTKRRDRAPSPNCLDGEYSWNVCSAGKFLCKTAWVPDCSDQQSTLMPALCETYSANVSHSTCVLSSGSVKLSRDDRTIPQACLNGIYHWGVCMNGKSLCSASTTRMLPNLLEQDSAHNAEQEYLEHITGVLVVQELTSHRILGQIQSSPFFFKVELMDIDFGVAAPRPCLNTPGGASQSLGTPETSALEACSPPSRWRDSACTWHSWDRRRSLR